MKRRRFLKTMGQAAVVAGTAPLASISGATAPKRITVAGVGDCIPSRRMSERTDRGFLDLVKLLRGVDCTWGNCETVFADPEKLYPAYKGLDPFTICEPWGAAELAWMGIDFMGLANNHTMDWGIEGLFSTMRTLDALDIPYGGAGVDLARSNKPSYFDSPAGRVGQVNFASSFRDHFAAGSPHPYVPGRPGLNPLHVEKVTQVQQDLFERIAALYPETIRLAGWAEFQDITDMLMSQMPEGTAYLGESMVKAGDKFDLLGLIDPEDKERITGAIKIARNNSRVVLATTHAHESYERLETEAPYINEMARACIDAGADIFFAAGPHLLRGIEMYKGKPIFYSLGNFVMHPLAQEIPASSWKAFGLPEDSIDPSEIMSKIPYAGRKKYWQSVVPVVTLEGGTGLDDGPGTVVDIELHPILLGFGEPGWRRGTPELVSGAEATEILELVARLSEPHGTSIRIRSGVGHVAL